MKLSCLFVARAAALDGVEVQEFETEALCSENGEQTDTDQWWQGCWDNKDGSTEIVISDEKVTVKTFKAQGCKGDGTLAEEFLGPGECTGTRKYKKITTSGDYIDMKYYPMKAGCPDDADFYHGLYTVEQLDLDKCKVKEEEDHEDDAFEKLTLDGTTLNIKRFSDKDCTKSHEKYPDQEVELDGTCQTFPEWDAETKKEVQNSGIYMLYNKDGEAVSSSNKSSSGHALHLSRGALAVAWVSLLAIVI